VETITLSSDIKCLKGPILVIGGGGFIGANLVHDLRAVRGDIYAGVNHLDNWRIAHVPKQYVMRTDVRDPDGLEAVLEHIQPQTILYLAGFGGYSFETDFQRIHDTNYVCLVRILERLSKRKFAALIHAGSSSEYGLNANGPDEDDHCMPNSHYAVSKVAASAAISFFGRVRGLPVINLRLYSAYGPYEDSARLIPNLVRCARSGTFPPLANSDISRDYVYIGDIVRAFVRAAIGMTHEIQGASFNIGTGRKITLRDAALIAKSAFNIPENPNFGSYSAREWDVKDWVARPNRAREILNWTAESSFEDGLKRTAEWQASLEDPKAYWLSTKATSAAKRNRSITAVVACYRDEPAIPIMYQRLRDTFLKMKVDYRIIFVNDGSPDQSETIIREITAKDPTVIGITHTRNFGSQMAFRSGMEIAETDSCVLLDGDLQDPPEIIEQFYAKWVEGYDVIYGVRVIRQMNPLSEHIYKLFYWLFNKVSDFPIPRDAGDFSLIDRKAVQTILESPERDLFIRGLRAYVGFKQIGVPYNRPKRAFGRSTNNLFRNIAWAKKAIFSFSTQPIHIMSAFASLLLFISVCLLLFIVVKTAISQTVPQGVPLIATLILFFGTLNFIGLAALGEYVGKIVTEVKRRPMFIRSAIIRNGFVEKDLRVEERVPRIRE